MGNAPLMADIQEALDDLDTAVAALLSKDEALRLATGQ
jgi:hypothetical protein